MNFKLNLKKFFLMFMVMSLVFVAIGCGKGDKDDDKNEYKQWTDEELLDLSTRDYKCENGIVAAASPWAAKAGLDVLQQGGNAFDAAVAVSFALGVTEPNASGIGGGGIMTAYEASTGEYISYNFREFVPAAGTATRYGVAEALDTGALSAGVPTQVSGLITIQENHGALKGVEGRQAVLAPAINYAENGFIVTPELGATINDNFNSIMDSKDETKKSFLNEDGEPIGTGELLIQKDYAKVLKEIADNGKEGFYTGWVAEAIVEAMEVVLEEGLSPEQYEKTKGIITLEDLEYAMNNYPLRETPIQGSYNGLDIITVNTPSSGGIILLETLNMLEVWANQNGKSLASLGHNTAEYIHVISTAMSLAYGDKQKYIADRRIENVPVEALISKEYAAHRWEKFDETRSYLGKFGPDGVNYGDPWPFQPDLSATTYIDDDPKDHYSTTAFSVCDKDGNIVSFTQTINHFFGNHIVPAGCGFFLNNQLSSLTTSASSAQYVKPYKQPVSHIMPTIVLKDGNPAATFGSPGSMRIPSAVIQTFLNIFEFDMNIQEAINAPRVYCYAAGGDDDATDEEYKGLYVEYAVPEEVRNELATKYKYRIQLKGSASEPTVLFFGGVQGITFNAQTGEIHGGADPRRDGKAIGF